MCALDGMDTLLLGAQGMGLPAEPLPLERLLMVPLPQGRVMTLEMIKCLMGRRGVQGEEVQAQAEQGRVST